MTIYEKLKVEFKCAQNILIISHVNPDGDTLGASLALYQGVKNKYTEKNVVLCVLGAVPELYEFLPCVRETVPIENINENQNFDMAIAVDVASKDRMAKALKFFDRAAFTVNIDHHKTNNNYAHLNFVYPEASSASEVMFEVLKGCDCGITKEIATCIYTGIMTDTGSFKYENTGVKTFEIASKLIAKGVNPSLIAKAYYEARPKAMVSLHACAVSSAQFLYGDKVAYTFITKEMFEKCNAKGEHTDGIAEVLRQIKTVEIAMVLKETSMGHTKVSMRSKNVDCAKLCEKYDGGGHTFAAGCTIKKPPKIALDKLIEDIKELYDV